ncbi:hypothetical protein PTKIN_Ptkin06aG0080100 [Pterospermum kingtungense]
MAKYGEGDKRWIMEERPNDANVYNWHWVETDCLPWSKTFFTKSLSNLTILNGEGNLHIKTKKVDKVNGKAYVNVHKGKIILGYEISLRAKDIVEILMDENRWKGFTQSNARIKEVGVQISIFDRSITGSNFELQEGKLIVQR